MKNSIYIIVIGLTSFLATFSLQGQEILPKEEAISIAMDNNFDIQISKNNVEIAENNASVQNSNYLPTFTGVAGANYGNSQGSIVQQSGLEQDIENNETKGLNASVSLNYILFDGFGRSNNYKKLKENYQISELQARQMIEMTLLDIFNSYYEVARLTQDVSNQKTTMDISKIRLQRARYANEFGQGSQLDILNAEVDYNNDSITYLTNTQLLLTEKRNLNLLLGRDITIDFEVDTTLSYATGLTLDILLAHAKENNVTLLQQERILKNAKYDIRTSQSNAIPKLSINGSYGWSKNYLGAASFIDQSQGYGPSVGATLSWNIFDGGSTRTRSQNAKIAVENQNISLNQEKLNIQRNLSNAWTAYQTALFVKNAETKNLQTAQSNFDKSVDQYKLGQITNIVFRQAQLNLLNAQLSLNRSKYSAKLAELVLLQISGDLRDAEF